MPERARWSVVAAALPPLPPPLPRALSLAIAVSPARDVLTAVVPSVPETAIERRPSVIVDGDGAKSLAR